MDEIIAVVPVFLALTSMFATIWMLKKKTEAEKKFILALQEELEREIANRVAELEGASKLTPSAEALGNNDPALVRSIYREALRNSGSGTTGIVFKALNDLAERDKFYINTTLKQNSMSGRFRYLSKLFRKAFHNVYGGMM